MLPYLNRNILVLLAVRCARFRAKPQFGFLPTRAISPCTEFMDLLLLEAWFTDVRKNALQQSILQCRFCILTSLSQCCAVLWTSCTRDARIPRHGRHSLGGEDQNLIHQTCAEEAFAGRVGGSVGWTYWHWLLRGHFAAIHAASIPRYAAGLKIGHSTVCTYVCVCASV